jgi:DNA segregation ATPase FtsK/SpoIIIE-like protein
MSRKSPFEILGVRADSSIEEISKAYRKMATLYHPDKVAQLAPEFQELAETRMKEINAAYLAIKAGKLQEQIVVKPSLNDLFQEALTIVTDFGRASTSVLQRRLSIGYGKAAEILDELERKGFIGPAEGSKPRKVLPAAYVACKATEPK